MRSSARWYDLFQPRSAGTSGHTPADLTWKGADSVVNAKAFIVATAMAMTWTSGVATVGGSTIIASTPADLTWKGASATAVYAVASELPKPRWLVRMGTPADGIKYMSTVDLDDFPTFYEGRLGETPALTITRSPREERWGVIEDDAIDFSIVCTPETPGGANYLPADAPETQRGQFVTVEHYDAQTEKLRVEWSGVFNSGQFEPGKVLRVHATAINTAVLETLIPSRLVDTTTWPKAVDVGKAAPIVCGFVAKMALLLVREHTPLTGTPEYDYLIGHGTLSVSMVYRGGPNETFRPVNYFEFRNSTDTGAATSWANACNTTLYPGFTVIRTNTIQLDYSNARELLRADVLPLAGFCAGVACPVGMERNFARLIRVALTNSAWSVGQTVDATSFDIAESVLAAIGNMWCDGALTEQIELQGLFTDLLMPREMRLGTLPDSTAWTLTVPTAQATPVMDLGDGLGDGERNFDLEPRTAPGLDDTTSKVILAYRENMVDGSLLLPAERALQAIGRPLNLENRFIVVIQTADKVVDFISKRQIDSQTRTGGTAVGAAALALKGGDLVRLTYADYDFAAQTFEVAGHGKMLDVNVIELRKYTTSPFTYSPGTFPPDPLVGTFADVSKVAPPPPQGLRTVPGTAAVERNDDGTWLARVDLEYVVGTNTAQTILQYRKVSDGAAAPWTTFAPSFAQGTVTATVRGLLTNVQYEAMVSALSPFGLPSGSASILFTTARKTALPTAPQSVTMTQIAKTVEVLVAGAPIAAEAADWGKTELYRATNPAFSGAVLVDFGKKARFHDQTVAWDGVYYYRARVFDTSENASVYTASAGGIQVTKLGGVDIGSGQIGTGNVAVGAISQRHTANIPGGVATVFKSLVPVPGATVSVDYALGDIILFWVTSAIYAQNNNPTGGANAHIGTRLVVARDGVNIGHTENFFSFAPPGYVLETPVTISGDDAPPTAGVHTYQVFFAVHFSAQIGAQATVGVAGVGGQLAVPIVLEVLRIKR